VSQSTDQSVSQEPLVICHNLFNKADNNSPNPKIIWFRGTQGLNSTQIKTSKSKQWLSYQTLIRISFQMCNMKLSVMWRCEWHRAMPPFRVGWGGGGRVALFIEGYDMKSWSGGSVGIATDYGLDGPGSNPGGDETLRPSRPALSPTQPPVKRVAGLSRG